MNPTTSPAQTAVRPTHDSVHVAVMDTTLRDGEQTPQLAYRPAEKLHIARMLIEQVGVDRIEVASAGVSDGEREAVQRIVAWARDAGHLDRIEVLGFCDGDASPRWLAALGARCMNLLTKGSEAHCRQQLGKTPAEHFADIELSLRAAARAGVAVTGAYLEDFSRGFDAEAGPGYVLELTRRLLAGGVQRVFLADTLGCLAPEGVERQVRAMCAAFPAACFEFHAHDDYGLATANALAAVRAGARGVHASVNGLGERAGNGRLCELVVALHDHAHVRTSVHERALEQIARVVETFSGKLLADNTPIVGRDVFTQTAGIHADGDRKADLYASQLGPERFGRRRSYALGKLAGRASLEQNLDQLGIALSNGERDRLLARIVELGDQKQRVDASDLWFLINDVLGRAERPRVIREYSVTVRRGQQACAEIELELGGRRQRASARASGGYAALMAALREAAGELGLQLPALSDFRVRIAAGGGSDALVETAIAFETEVGPVTLIGVDADQLGAAVIATEKMLQLLAARVPLTEVTTTHRSGD
jgi:(R)-citramalate synthase